MTDLSFESRPPSSLPPSTRQCYKSAMHHFCMICGGFMRASSEGPGIKPPAENLEWDQIVRAGKSTPGSYGLLINWLT